MKTTFLICCALGLATAAVSPSQETYTGPFLEFEDDTNTITAVKPTSGGDIEIQGCSGSLPKLCALSAGIDTAKSDLDKAQTDMGDNQQRFDEGITANLNQIKAATTDIEETTKRVSDMADELSTDISGYTGSHACLGTQAEGLKNGDKCKSQWAYVHQLMDEVSAGLEGIIQTHNDAVTKHGTADMQRNTHWNNVLTQLDDLKKQDFKADFSTLTGKDSDLAAADAAIGDRIQGKLDLLLSDTYRGDVGSVGERGATGTKGVTGAKGEVGVKGATGDQGAIGETGAQGAKGETGAQGEKGETGDVGAAGAKGETGATGATGDKGAAGEAGAEGRTGYKGERGETGDIGRIGYKGAKGETGGIGSIGATGVQGERGETGAQGEAGDKGETGAQGDKGATGEQGEKGETGAQGAKGETGVQGEKGETGNVGSIGAKGAKGETGATGSQGATGEAGMIGGKGLRGETGATGAKGATGAAGVTGNKGEKGEAGATGEQGQQGATGGIGSTGMKGDTGDKGATGAKGEAGELGVIGFKGAKGEQGGTGAIGSTGSKGEKGEQGDMGAAGTAGGVGFKGAKGESGSLGGKGAKGETGSTGGRGMGGITGEKGDTGATGNKGEKGNTGNKGATGAKGDKGTSGDKGDTGANGNKGEKGASGDQGAVGAKGNTGANGNTGASGDKGDKGEQGGAGEKGDTGEKGAKGAKGNTGAEGDATKGEAGEKGAKGAKGDAGNDGEDGKILVTTTPAPPSKWGRSKQWAGESCMDLYNKGERLDGNYWIKQDEANLLEPDWTYIGRFHGRAHHSGAGGYGNEMSPMQNIWDHNLDSGATASISGWAMTRSTIPAGVEFDYHRFNNFPISVKYAVNGFHARGNLKIYADGKLVVSRDFDEVDDYTLEDHELVVKGGFRKIKFMLEGDVSGLGPHPNFKIYEIYPAGNLEGRTGEAEPVQQVCKFSWGETSEFAVDSCADARRPKHGGNFYVAEQYNRLPEPIPQYTTHFMGYEVYHVFDKVLSTSFHATSIQPQSPHSVTFDYGQEYDFPVAVRYGVNMAADLTIKLDGKAVQQRSYPPNAQSPYHVYNDVYSNFRKIQFELKVANNPATGMPYTYPYPTIKIYEIYAQDNLEGRTGTHVALKHCDV